MKHKIKALCSVALVAGMVCPPVQAATTYTWDFTGSDGISGTSTNSATNWREFTSISGSKTVTVRALYSENDGSLNTSNLRARETSSSNYARIRAYSGGLGIINPTNTNEDDPYDPSNPPAQHSVDNSGRDEFLLFDFGEVMDLNSFRIGFDGGDTDIDIWVGPNNASNVDFFAANGTSNGTSIPDLISAGFTKYNTFSNVAVNSTVATDPNLPGGGNSRGRYMLVSGALNSNNNDSFKFSQLTMASTPTPGTFALLGIGLVAVAWSRRGRIRSV